MYHSRFIHSPIEGHLGYFQVVAITFMIAFKAGMKFVREGCYLQRNHCAVVIYMEIVIMDHQYAPM